MSQRLESCRWEGAVLGGIHTNGNVAMSHVAGHAEEALRGAPDLVVIVDESGVIEFISASSTELLGFTPQEMLGHRGCDFLGTEDRRNAVAWLAHACRGASLPDLAHHVTRADGELATFETRVRRMQRDDKTAALVAVSRDVSARAALDEELADTTTMWSEVVDVVPEGVVILDDDGVVLAANRVACELLGTSAIQLCGTPIRRHVTIARSAPGRTIQCDPLSPRALSSLTGTDQPLTLQPTGRPVTFRGRAALLPPLHRARSKARTVLLLEASAVPADPGSRPDQTAPHGTDALSPREVEVLRLLAEGLDVRAIAGRLGISIHTVRAYVKSILKKLDARTQLQAVVVALRSRVLDLS